MRPLKFQHFFPEDDSESSDFEDVPEKEGFEPRIPDHLREEYGLVNKVILYKLIILVRWPTSKKRHTNEI